MLNVQSRKTQNRSVIVAAIANSEPVAIEYLAANGIRSQRVVRPNSIERCRNGRTIVRAFDPQRKQARTFGLDRITTVVGI